MTPTPDGPLPLAPELANAARDFRLRMAVIDRENETALDTTRDPYGRTVHASAAAAARGHRDKTAIELATAIVGGGGLATPPLEAGLRALWPTVLL
ncbi:hypothetical protein [Streptomyces mirabilis]|uniref:hypothetical protein n=1 Tax=Streptomyces mirabilis TaxID=68239 RepID=UPI00369F40F3